MLLIGLLLIGIVVFIVTFISYQWIENWTFGNAKWAAEKLDLMFITASPQKTARILMIGPFILGIVMGFLFWPNVFFSLFFGTLVAILGFKLPKPLIDLFLKKRLQKLNVQLVDGLTLMASSLRSGLSLMQAIQVVQEQMPNPLSQEMNLILSEQRLGTSVEKSFQNFAARANIEDIEMFATAVVVLRETGGNLAETFATIVHTIRERMKIQNKISALTAQGVLQGTIITLMPFALMILLYLIDPSHMMPLFSTLPGYIMLFLMLCLQAIGGLMIKKIVTIRV